MREICKKAAGTIFAGFPAQTLAAPGSNVILAPMPSETPE